jgi:hypothetical protein
MKFTAHTKRHASPASDARTSWSPGQPYDPALRPNAQQALARNADVWERSQIVREFPVELPQPTTPTNSEGRKAA